MYIFFQRPVELRLVYLKKIYISSGINLHISKLCDENVYTMRKGHMNLKYIDIRNEVFHDLYL